MNSAQIKGIREVAYAMNTKKTVEVRKAFDQFGVCVDGVLVGVCLTEAGAVELAKIVQ